MDADTFINYGDSRRIRMDDGASLDEITRDDQPSADHGSPCIVGVTTTVTTYPTTAQRFYAITVQAILGTETEGGAGTVTARSGRIYALNLGSSIPPNGTKVVCDFVPYRWVFRYD